MAEHDFDRFEDADGEWFLPGVHVFEVLAEQAQPLELLEELIQDRKLLPRHLVYRKGERVDEAISFPELRRYFVRYYDDIGEVARNKVFIPPALRERLYDLARHHGTVEPLPKKARSRQDEVAPWRLPNTPELYGLRGMQVAWTMIDRVIREGRLLPDHLVQHQGEAPRPAGSFPELQVVFAETYPNFDPSHYPEQAGGGASAPVTGPLVGGGVGLGLTGLLAVVVDLGGFVGGMFCIALGMVVGAAVAGVTPHLRERLEQTGNAVDALGTLVGLGVGSLGLVAVMSLADVVAVGGSGVVPGLTLCGVGVAVGIGADVLASRSP